MKPQPAIRQLTTLLLIPISLLFMGCGSFETVSYYNDGIYGDEAVAAQPKKKTSNSDYYKKYFDEKAVEAGQNSAAVLFTDPNGYTDADQEVAENSQYQTYGNWGDQTDQINVTINGYYPYNYGFSPYYNYYYHDIHYRPWWRHRYRSWYRWSYYYPNYYYGWYGYYRPHYGHYHYYHPHNGYYTSYGSGGATYVRAKGRRGSTSSTSASSRVAARSVSGSEKFSSVSSPTAGRISNDRRATAERPQTGDANSKTSRKSSSFMSRDFSAPRVYQRNDGRKAVSAGRSNNAGSSYQVKSYRVQNSNNRASQSARSSNFSSSKSQSNYSPSYNNSNSRSSSSYSSGRSYSRSSSSGGRSSSGSSRSSSSGRR